MKFEYVFGGVMPSPTGVNASLSKDLDHVGEAEICCIRRGTGEAPYCEAKNDERKWGQKEDRSHGLVSTANTARQGRRKKTNAAKLSRLF